MVSSIVCASPVFLRFISVYPRLSRASTSPFIFPITSFSFINLQTKLDIITRSFNSTMVGTQALLELDFLGLDKQHSSDRRQRFRGIHKAISKMNPEVIKSVFASAGAQPVSSPLPVYVAPPTSGGVSMEKDEQTAPMTIFYNGMVTAFDLPKDQAEIIMKMAMAESSKNIISEKVGATSSTLHHQGDIFEEGLPISRRKSLERFFEKRKERLMSTYPYEIPKGPRGNRS